MRRLLALAAALVLVAGPLATSGPAAAKDHREMGRGGGDRGGEGRWPGGGRWERGGEGPGNGNGNGNGNSRWERREEPRYEPRNDPRYEGRYEGRGYEPAPSYGPPRRGGFLGPRGGAPIEDPGRFRLRAAPRGYQWVRVPGGMALVSQATGQVFDVVPY